MWCASKFGWVSIVRKGGNGNQWQVRVRVRQDLAHLVAAAKLEGQKIIESLDADYGYRIVIGKEELHQVFTALENSIDYGNFKQTISKIRGQEKHLAAYHRIWSIMAGLQPSRHESSGSLWERVDPG